VAVRGRLRYSAPEIRLAAMGRSSGSPGSCCVSCYLHGCPCGFSGDSTREGRCTPAVPFKELRDDTATESSAEIRARVERARGFYNSRMPTRLIRKHCALDAAGERTLEMAVRRLSLSARAHDRILKVSRTIADLDESAGVSAKHIAEAAQYRSLDQNYWT
jgi:magnesium chelatase family protein